MVADSSKLPIRNGPALALTCASRQDGAQPGSAALRYFKIDRSFVVDLVRSRDDQRVVQSILGIAQSFGLEVLAEGVEDAATLDLISQLGAEYAQGFYLGRPAPIR
jgi:EAL domain-containing protein (putative c-di-GMP-specific phosphodiesterase class I)